MATSSSSWMARACALGARQTVRWLERLDELVTHGETRVEVGHRLLPKAGEPADSAPTVPRSIESE
jgi:hypothetical protein